MRKTILALSMLFTVDLSAVRVEVPAKHDPEYVTSEHQAAALRNALKTFTLEDGSVWVTHFVEAKSERSAIGVTRFNPDGTARLFLLSDFLPEGSIPRGACGQIHGVTTMTDGRLAVSGGWNDGRESHNAIVFLQRRKDERYERERMIELPGVAQIAGGPDNSILAITHDPARRGGGPLLTIFNTEGRAVAELGSERALGVAEAAQNAADARLLRVRPNRFATYDPSREEVHVFEVALNGRETVLQSVQVLFIGTDAELARVRVLDIDIAPQARADIVVVRSGKYRGQWGTYFTVYDAGNQVKQTASVNVPWNLMYREKDAIRGVYRRNDVRLDRVHLRAE